MSPRSRERLHTRGRLRRRLRPHERLRELNRLLARHRRVSFLVAVARRFDEDRASQLGALIAFYAFFSLFPLLLVFVTVLGFILEGNPHAQQSVLDSTIGQLPIIGTQLRENVHSLHGSGVTLAIGLVGALLAGLGLTGATERAFDGVWRIPRRRQRGFVSRRLRGLSLLAVVGTLSIASAFLAGYVTISAPDVLEALGGAAAAFAGNLLIFFIVFRMLTSEEVGTRDLIAGVIVGAVLWQLLQHVGSYYVDHVVRHAKETSALFAFVLGLLTWLYLGGQVLMVAAEVNVVRAQRLPDASFSSTPEPEQPMLY
jgi:inner membrane protein YhjD